MNHSPVSATRQIGDSDVKLSKPLPKKLESDIQRDICDWLHSKDFFFWRQNNIPVFGASGDGHRRYRAMPKYSLKGLPDIVVLYNGHYIALEVKRPKAKQTPEQLEIEKKTVDNGGLYFVVTSIEEASVVMNDIVRIFSVNLGMPPSFC